MAKILKVSFPEKCIGCELCVFAAQRLLQNIGIEDSPVKVLGDENGFSVHLDPKVNELDIKKISEICPKGVFTIEEEDSGSDLSIKEEQ